MKVIACYSMKGGVGKTATSVNVAYMAAQSGMRTLLIDMDPQGASSFYFRIKPAKKELGERFFSASKVLFKQIKASDFENLEVIPAQLSFRNFDSFLSNLKKRRTRLNKVFKGFGREYDLVVLDCPPTISHLSEAVFTAADIIFVPVIPTTLSERTYEQLLEFFKANDYPRKHLVPFFSMVESQKALHNSTMESMRRRYKRFLQATIPFSIDVEKMGEHRAPLDTFASHRPANKAFQALWQEMRRLIEAA
ncbi:MAG: AAA family ATPase [Chromatiales bacterium]|jgi:chromosome partitioning protein